MLGWTFVRFVECVQVIVILILLFVFVKEHGEFVNVFHVILYCLPRGKLLRPWIQSTAIQRNMPFAQFRTLQG